MSENVTLGLLVVIAVVISAGVVLEILGKHRPPDE
jgi:hypothetical protein